MAHAITLIPGDGAGPALTGVTRRVLEATGVAFDWDEPPAGEAAWASVRRTKVALRAPAPADAGLDVLSATRPQIELYVRAMEERGLAATTIDRRLSTVCGFYRFAHIDGRIASNPAQYVRHPRIHPTDARGLDRAELGAFPFAAESRSPPATPIREPPRSTTTADRTSTSTPPASSSRSSPEADEQATGAAQQGLPPPSNVRSACVRERPRTAPRGHVPRRYRPVPSGANANRRRSRSGRRPRPVDGETVVGCSWSRYRPRSSREPAPG